MNDKGRLGEEKAAEYLKEKGCLIIEKNYHSRYGEIDLICRKDSYLLFVEVKERKKNSLVNPLEAVTLQKQKKLIITAQQYVLQHKEISLLQPRFDVVAVSEEYDGTFSFLHIENAF